MKIKYVGRNIDVTEGLKSHVEGKLSKLGNYFDAEKSATVVMSTQKGHHKVEITITVKDIVIRAEEVLNDMYTAIDVVVDKLERKLRKEKSRIKKKCHKTIRHDVFDAFDSECTEEINSIVKRKVVNAKPMSEDEAILQMELLHHDFFVFLNLSNVMTVIYKRKDGNYGLIESC